LATHPLTTRIRDFALELGFVDAGFAPAGPSPDAPRLLEWLEAGHAGEMGFMHERIDERCDAQVFEPTAKTVISLLAPYPDVPDAVADSICRYALGDDYHLVLDEKLRALAAFVHAEAGTTAMPRAAVDGAPVLERSIAVQAGIGWLGKSGMVISQTLGSYVLLSELFVDVEIASDRDPHPDRCGRCTRCIDVCPTKAIIAPYTIDARLCIAYLTIEHRGAIPRELRPLIGSHLFGCDLCQSICPWNGEDGPEPMPEFTPRREVVFTDAEAALAMTQSEFSKRFARSPVKRAKRAGLARNAAIVLGNSGEREWVGALARALSEHDVALVRGHAAWALGRLGGLASELALRVADAQETDAYVRDEIRAAQGATDARSARR
jgi:epoxyqueuosine reductase